MFKKILIFVSIVLLVVLILGGWFWWQSKNQIKPQANQEQEDGQEKEKFVTDVDLGVESADERNMQLPQKKKIVSKSEPRIHNFDPVISTNDWKTYHNDSLGFSIKYPNNWTVEDVQNQYVESTINRYITFRDQDQERFYINLGVKKESESSITPREFRTGVPGGDFFTGNTIKFGQGTAEERYLIDCYWEGNRCSVELVWFCEKGSCDNFSIGRGRVAFMEVGFSGADLNGMSVPEVMNIVHRMIETFH